MEEKTEKPTAKKLKDARKKGQVAQSKEVVSTALISLILLYFWATADFYVNEMMALIAIPSEFYLLPFDQALNIIFQAIAEKLVVLLLPVLALLVLVAILSNMLQVGVMFVTEPMKPELKKINPVEGVKRIVSIKNLVEFLKSVLKILLLSFLIYGVIVDNLKDVLGVTYCGVRCLLPLVGILFKSIILYSIAAFLVIAVADFAFQKTQHIKQLKMSKDEVKREYKQSEGDPEIKGKRKQFQQELINSSVTGQVKKSSVIVTNPTHVAVGLFYDHSQESLPVVTVKGIDMLAQRIKKIASDEDIPIMENVPLARALLATGDVDAPIPADLIEPVAEVLRWVESLESDRW